MGYRERSAPPSKGEIAFRFLACTGIALALYYTPELKWGAEGSDVRIVQLDEDPPMPASEPLPTSCATREAGAVLLDASIGGR